MQHPTLICNRCESPLIQVSKTTEKLDNYLSPMTTTKYICSDKECQAKADAKYAEAEERRAMQEKSKANRFAQNAANKAASQAASAASSPTES